MRKVLIIDALYLLQHYENGSAIVKQDTLDKMVYLGIIEEHNWNECGDCSYRITEKGKTLQVK